MKFGYVSEVMQVIISRAGVQTRFGSDLRTTVLHQAVLLPLRALLPVCSVGRSHTGPCGATV